MAKKVKRIGILTAGGDTPALNATILGTVIRASELKVEVYGLIKGFNSLLNPRVPHVHLNPLFQAIPELDSTYGGTMLAASRDYLDPDDTKTIALVCDRLRRLHIDGLICVGGDGTLNAMQPLSEALPAPPSCAPEGLPLPEQWCGAAELAGSVVLRRAGRYLAFAEASGTIAVVDMAAPERRVDLGGRLSAACSSQCIQFQ